MENANIKNLSQYKYAYKIYIANEKLNSERIKLIYVNKECIIVSEGDKVRTISSRFVFLEEELESAITLTLGFWIKYKIPNEYFIISKNKLDKNKIRENKYTRINIIKKRIEDKRREIEKNQKWIESYKKQIERFEKQIISLELEMSELTNKLKEEE